VFYRCPNETIDILDRLNRTKRHTQFSEYASASPSIFMTQ
jgi:hypothetical protein